MASCTRAAAGISISLAILAARAAVGILRPFSISQRLARESFNFLAKSDWEISSASRKALIKKPSLLECRLRP
jgi:hypothetical protein